MGEIERGREQVKEFRRVKNNKAIHLVKIWRNDLLSVLALISHLEAKAARGERIEAAARKTVKYECWADPRFDYYEKFCRGCECEWICQALGGEERWMMGKPGGKRQRGLTLA